ncbi:hypothetical protein RSAG8_03641, partial [Rhizoctonia solani AG-8 WAC10335]
MYESTRQEKNTQKDSKFCITLLVNALAFQLSHKNNQMQKLICIYLKAKGVPKSCFFFFLFFFSKGWSLTKQAMNGQERHLSTSLLLLWMQQSRCLTANHAYLFTTTSA